MKDDQGIPQPKLPERMSHLAYVPELAEAWEHAVKSRRQNALQLSRLLAYRGRCRAEADGGDLYSRSAADQAAVRDAAVVLGLSERTATRVLNQAQYVRESLPRVWERFCAGVVCMARLRRIADGTGAVANQPELLEILDAELAEMAGEQNPTELKHWLARRISQLDAELYEQSAAAAKQDRYVRIEHLDCGLSFVEALIPTAEAVSIQRRLRAAASAMHRPQPKDTEQDYQPASTGQEAPGAGAPEDALTDADDRTLAQREADLFSAWLRDGRNYAAPVSAKICVMVPEPTLRGQSDEPAMGADRSWMLPASEIRKLAADPNAEHQWYTAVTRKKPRQADHQILSIVSNGRFVPPRLRDALIFRDGVCQHPGCTVPAERSDFDHKVPYERDGPTSAENLWALCRRHHNMKSHGYLLPPPPSTPWPPPSRSGSSPPGRGGTYRTAA
ncbi:HNH endonuclease signature motif containing protein [Nesterenkonia alkaliphila]|nr:HNH endonuclease signature motif containing protein [Nesterenkonia alkaliphila]GFZ91198.1 hypothetical protein GCM10011359_20730 [Nesterenkonia alkaliphila]